MIEQIELDHWRKQASLPDPLDRTPAEVIILKLIAELEALRKTRFEADKGKTHWEGCWRDHYRCAMAKIEGLEKK